MDLFTLTGAFLAGTAVAVPLAYGFSWITGSILWGTVLALILSAAVATRIKFRRIRIDASSMFLLLFSLTFSTWMMFKTFHGDSSGQLFVGSNNVFDFGHSLGLVRSFSWGSNIPIASPFEAGLPSFYHFLFYFLAAVLEYFHVPLVWAINILSILSFTALLVIIYYFPQIVFKQKPLVGWVAVILTITNSSLTFWKLLPRLPSIWHLGTYPFAGPYDGSTISLYVTLNSYVNQRHLAFSIALGLFLYLTVLRLLWAKKLTAVKSVLVGVLMGLLFYWNVAVCALVILLILLLILIHGEWKMSFTAVVSAGIIILLTSLPYVPYAREVFQFLFMSNVTNRLPNVTLPTWKWPVYLWENLGILPLIAGIGFATVTRKMKKSFLPVVFLFIGLCLLAAVGKRGFDQKFFSFLIIGVNILAAQGVYWLWKRSKIIAGLVLFVLTISGVVDLMPIKNEFAFTIINQKMLPVVSWIHTRTPINSVFVSYADIIDPVVLGGRKNYFGYFGDIGWRDRSSSVGTIYSGDIKLAKSLGISYILVPKWEKNDFPYKIRLDTIPIVFEDANYRVYKL